MPSCVNRSEPDRRVVVENHGKSESAGVSMVVPVALGVHAWVWGFMRRRIPSLLLGLCVVAAAWACSLNPQPLPPDSPVDSGGGGADATLNASPDASQDGAGGALDAGSDGTVTANEDGGDASEDAADASDGASDAADDGDAADTDAGDQE